MRHALLDVDLADLLPLGAGLRGLQHHAEHAPRRGSRASSGERASLIAAALAAPAGVDLGLHRADAAAELAGGALGLERRGREVARAGTATPNFRRISLAWYSWIFTGAS